MLELFAEIRQKTRNLCDVKNTVFNLKFNWCSHDVFVKGNIMHLLILLKSFERKVFWNLCKDSRVKTFPSYLLKRVSPRTLFLVHHCAPTIKTPRKQSAASHG